MIQLKTLHSDLNNAVARHKKDKAKLRASRQVIERALLDGKAYYGINTGFGPLANKRIPAGDLKLLQKNILMSHAIGVGEFIPRDITRLMLQLKIHSLALGFSGISEGTFDQLVSLMEKDLIPAVPSKGSVGASGDLAPLAHMCLPLIGEGEVWDSKTHVVRKAREALKEAKLSPIELQAKDGLALINGTQMMSAYGAHVLHKAMNLVKCADILAAMGVEAQKGSAKSFDSRIHDIRPHVGQRAVAENICKLLVGSEILESHKNCDKVQDQYSLRCVPQVHGASRDALNYANNVVETELNSVTDNPLVFENGDILSGGNFHGQPLALALDFAAMALAELASISERRTYLLLSGLDGLPILLTEHPGTNSGFMIAQYTAAALVSENKVLCHPSSVDSIPTSLGQEDHVSMGSISAHKLLKVFENVENVLALELLTSAQALDFRMPLRPGRGVEIAHQTIRQTTKHVDVDKIYQEDLASCRMAIHSGSLVSAVEAELGELI